MASNPDKCRKQLGISISTARCRLIKKILFSLVEVLQLNVCYRCGKIIDSSEELSIEHKEPWLDSDDPVGLYYDLHNIAFSHLECNSKAGRYSQYLNRMKQ